MSTNPQSAISARSAVWLMNGTPLERATRLLAVLTGFSIPLSTSFSEITTGLFMACWILSGDFAAKWAIIRRNAVALLSLALFGLLLAGMTWSAEGWLVSGRCLLKYRELVYLPMFVVVFQEPRLRSLATYAFMAAACTLLGLSYFEWLSGADYGISSGEDYVIAKDRIIHSLIMAFLVYLAAVEFVRLPAESARGARAVRRWQLVYGVVIALATGNILFMLHGRTGYLSLGALTTLFLCERMGKRGIAIACLLLGATAWGAFNYSSSIRGRVDQTIGQLQSQFGPERKHAPDPRLEFYENTLKIIGRHPFIGTGTGSFRTQYANQIEHSDDRPTSDPHNEYLNLASQVGLPGAALFVVMLAVQWFSAVRLSGPDLHIGRGVVLAVALGSLFNSLILSVTGGLIYSYFSGLAFASLSQPAGSAATPSAEITGRSPVAEVRGGAPPKGERRAA